MDVYRAVSIVNVGAINDRPYERIDRLYDKL